MFIDVSDDELKKYKYLASYEGVALEDLIKRLLNYEILACFDSVEHLERHMKIYSHLE